MGYLFRACASALLALSALHATAQTITIPINGFLVDASDYPVTGTLAVTSRVYAQQIFGTPVLVEPRVVNASGGLLNFELGDVQPIDQSAVFPTGEQRYLEVEVGGYELLPRVLIDLSSPVNGMSMGGTFRLYLGTAIPRDNLPPNITISSPYDGAKYTRDSVVPVSYTCVDDPGMAPPSATPPTCFGSLPVGAQLDTSSGGIKQFTVISTDSAGNTATKSVVYEVLKHHKEKKEKPEKK